MVDQHLLVWIGDVDPAHRHGDDLRARGLDGAPRLVEIPVLAGADDETRREPAAGDDEGVVFLGRLGVAAADEVDDFQPVAVADHDVAVG